MVHIERISELACLSFSPEEKETLAREMEEILAFARELPDLSPMDDPSLDAVNVAALRVDETAPCLPREALLAAAPDRTEDSIVVPRIQQE